MLELDFLQQLRVCASFFSFWLVCVCMRLCEEEKGKKVSK
jgi:hypothetical protein